MCSFAVSNRKTKVPGSSPVTSYVQGWAVSSNLPDNFQMSVKQVEMLQRSYTNGLSLPFCPVNHKYSSKKIQVEKNCTYIILYYTCIDIIIYIYIYIYVYIYIYNILYLYLSIYIYLYTYLYIYIYMLYIYIYIYIFAYVYTCLYLYILDIRREREREKVITMKKWKNYIFEKYFRLTSLSIHCIYISLKTVT